MWVGDGKILESKYHSLLCLSNTVTFSWVSLQSESACQYLHNLVNSTFPFFSSHRFHGCLQACRTTLLNLAKGLFQSSPSNHARAWLPQCQSRTLERRVVRWWCKGTSDGFLRIQIQIQIRLWLQLWLQIRVRNPIRIRIRIRVGRLLSCLCSTSRGRSNWSPTKRSTSSWRWVLLALLCFAWCCVGIEMRSLASTVSQTLAVWCFFLLTTAIAIGYSMEVESSIRASVLDWHWHWHYDWHWHWHWHWLWLCYGHWTWAVHDCLKTACFILEQ